MIAVRAPAQGVGNSQTLAPDGDISIGRDAKQFAHALATFKQGTIRGDVVLHRSAPDGSFPAAIAGWGQAAQ